LTPKMRRIAPAADMRIICVEMVSAYAADKSSGIVPLTVNFASYAVSYCTKAGLFQEGRRPRHHLRTR
jgi:hypothetical protein